MGFPRGFTDMPKVSATTRAMLMGNALVVGIVTRIGEALYDAIQIKDNVTVAPL